MTGFYRFIRAIVGCIFRIIFPLRVEGLENLPASGPVILCANHTSMLDPVAMILLCPRPISFMAKTELFENKLLGWLFRKMGAFAVKRGESDLASVRLALRVLEEGKIFGIFPQGHRNHEDEAKGIQTGTAMIALRSGAVTIPVHISGGYRLFRRTTVCFKAPMDLENFRHPISAKAIEQASECIMNGIWEK